MVEDESSPQFTAGLNNSTKTPTNKRSKFKNSNLLTLDILDALNSTGSELLLIEEDDFNLSVSTRQFEIFMDDSKSVISGLPTPSEIGRSN